MSSFFDKQPPVLYFHSVAPKKNRDWIRSYLTLELKYFEDLLKFISKKKLKSFFISELGDNNYQLNNSIALTFDDGYLDNWVYVFPLLKKYNVKATIFCSTEYIEYNDIVRYNLEDVWSNKIKMCELSPWGFCSVNELNLMIKSGLVDVQSHTRTHDKIPVSSKIVGFNSPENNNFNFLFPSKPYLKPYYINQKEIFKSLSLGYPLFEEKSAIISKRVWINPDYVEMIVENSKAFDWSNYNFHKALEFLSPLIEKFETKNNTIIKSETEPEYLKRIENEIIGSKNDLEKILNKKIDTICWPHGDFNPEAVEIARKAGYKKIHYVTTKKRGVLPSADHFVRMGMRPILNNRFLTNLKLRSDIYSHIGKFPYKQIKRIYQIIK